MKCNSCASHGLAVGTVAVFVLIFSIASGGVISSSNSTDSNSSTLATPVHLRDSGFDVTQFKKYARDNDFSDQDLVNEAKSKRKKSRSNLTSHGPASTVVLPKFVVNNGQGRGCSTGTIATPITTSTLNNLLGGNIGAWLGEGAVAIAIIIALFWIKVIIIALIAWWWYGSSGKSQSSGDEGYGWGPPKPVYGPPKPQYGAPMSGYGRQLYESMDFSRLSEKVLGALDFVEKFYTSLNEDGSRKKSS